MIYIFRTSSSIFGSGLSNTKQKYVKQGFFGVDPLAGLSLGH